jgi:hypothetical protein
MSTIYFRGTTMEKSAIRVLALLLGCLLISAAPAAAGLLTDDSVNVTLSLGPTTITDTTVDPGGAPGFVQATFGIVQYQVFLFDDGFFLSISCVVSCPGGVFQNELTLVLADLDFTPPAALTGLIPSPGNDPELAPVAGSPTFTASSITIEFQAFTLDSGGFGGTFVTSELAAVPSPATVVLLFAGLGVVAALRRRA